MAENSGRYVCEHCGEKFETPGEKGGHLTKIDRDELLREIRRLAAEKDRVPTTDEMQEEGRYSATTVKERFGSWTDGLRAAGLEPKNLRNIPEETIIRDIQRVAEQVEGTPTADDMTEFGTYSRTAAQHKFGSWNDALRQAGFTPNRRLRISDEALVSEMRRLTGKLGHTPSAGDMAREGRYSHRPYYRRYGDWKRAVRAAGLEPLGRQGLSGSDHPNWVGGDRLRYGPNWLGQRQRTLERDDYECQMPGCDLSDEEHAAQFGNGLHVHHIVPLRWFESGSENIDYEQANSLGNLVTLCHPHHEFWEKISPLRPDARHLS